ncbi:glycoside hydrolase/phage tail family protein [Hyphomonas sp. WL0036]|uniref:baseplate multidomain protein megatron n=1 Tax=Hyphomonas sediminis TaxID=2866160 RepID=UPI001C7E4932|nr:glycoside hydrolase/phage tail family protein [Hyphomonas sediminis]MBY9067293.1 glycoside hydrolase/phage tail family protein [Hyphomonas sediminis]
MAQIAFAEIGAAVGARLLPAGLNVAGRAITGAAIGRAAGAMAGRALGNYLAGPAEGPRLKALYVMEAAEGAGVSSVYGRMRVAGQLVWAARLRERRTTRSVGSKGGPRVNEYSYSVSFAVALGEGPGVRVVRAWANGEAFDFSAVTHRLYDGSEGQVPDPLIEMIEGAAPAYRGTAYIVFEDLPLDAFGNRLPQLSFEIVRVPPGDSEPGLKDSVTGVNIIPASGEFVYATEIVREQFSPGRERAINANSGEARADFLVSLDQMQEGLPRVTHTALAVGWFGSSLDVGACVIRPGVEARTRVTVPQVWNVAGEDRAEAYLISRDEGGNANYGGTPSDASAVQAIRELKDRGYAVTLTPFLMMDAPGFPWRGRIGVSEDGTASARAEIEAFVDGPQGYRRFILHHAALAAQAGGVEAFLVGSEMRGLTRVRDEGGAFPFVEALRDLAAEVKALLPGTKVSYAADWTEYGAYVPGDGSGDVLFPLDALWADAAIDFVGIDWYPPLGDWRAGAEHLDLLAGYAAADDPAYLERQIEGGEAFDWYYADEAARATQVRTPINDSAHGEHWVFRVKDLSGWSGNLHYPRPGGVRASLPTAWTPGMKPIRLSEIGFAAVDKGGNAPNVFYDPKSSESALPPFSTGERDDVFQKRALGVTLAHFEASPLVEAAHVWAWDARPYPAWPMRDDIWGDGGNWARGHWLNGREGLTSLAAVVGDICPRGGVEADVRGLDGVIEGYGLDGVHSVRAALEPLKAAFGFEVVERPEGLVFHMGDAVAAELSSDEIAEPGLKATRQLMDKAPERIRLAYIDPDRDYQPGVAQARRGGGDARLATDVTLPLVLSPARAEAAASALLAAAAADGTAEITLPLAGMALEPGDRLRVDGGPEWCVSEAREAGAQRTLTLVRDTARVSPARDGGATAAPEAAPVFAGIDLVVMDAPSLPGEAETGPLVAAYASPWPGEVAVIAGPSADGLSERARLVRPAVIGRLTAPVEAGPVGRWDRAAVIELDAPGGEFASASEAAVLAGANAALLETAAGWELVQFADAELVGPERWRLSGLLRGQGGRASGAAEAGARIVLLDDAVVRARVSALEAGLMMLWRAAGLGEANEAVFDDRAGLAWRPAWLPGPAGWVNWARRGRDVPDQWDLPDPASAVSYAVEADFGAGFDALAVTDVAGIAWPEGAICLRIAQIGTDGRTGEWLSIPAGSPYL